MSLERKLAEFAVEKHPSQAVAVLERLDPENTGEYLESTSIANAAAVVQRLTPQHRTFALECLKPDRISKIVATVSTEVAVRMLRPLNHVLRNEILKVLGPKKSRVMSLMLEFKDGTAGALMDPDALALPQDLSAKEALQWVRKQPESSRYNLYVVDQDQRLIGALNLRELLVVSSGTLLSEIMTKQPFRVLATADRALMVAHIGWKHVHSLPVVDIDDAFLGVIRYRTLRQIEAELHDAQHRDADTGAALSQVIVAAAGGVLDALGGSSKYHQGATRGR